MEPAGVRVLLLGPTTTVGRELLLRLALLGFEVVAYLPDGNGGDTGEFACELATDPHSRDGWAAIASVIVDAQTEEGRSVLVQQKGLERRFAHAPLIGHAIEQVRSAGWRELLRDPWRGRALPLIHEREVAQIVVNAIVRDQPETALGGPEALTWGQLARRVLAVSGADRLWHHLVGRWPANALPESVLDQLARYPRIGRRSVADALIARS